MARREDLKLTRREFVTLSLAIPGIFLAGIAEGGQALDVTPECPDADDVTPRQTEGPFYKPRSPERHWLLEPGVQGKKIILEGRILSTDCKPVSRALLDFWHADAAGEYDNAGYKFRGHQYADDQGRYRLETIVPGLYPGRTRHFHVRVQPPNRSILTTQLYFPNEPSNKRDGIFHPKLLVVLRDTRAAAFDFVVR